MQSKTPQWLLDAQKLDVQGRDDFRTSLIVQEFPFWVEAIRSGYALIAKSEVEALIKRRGFNKSEATKFRGLATFLARHAGQIRDSETPQQKAARYLKGFGHGAQGTNADDIPCQLYAKGYKAGSRARRAAGFAFLDPAAKPAAVLAERKACATRALRALQKPYPKGEVLQVGEVLCGQDSTEVADYIRKVVKAAILQEKTPKFWKS
jgi:hypothetical protein